MSSRFGSSTLHQRDARSALFDGYDRRSRSGTPGSTSSTPARGGGSAMGPGNGNPYSSMGGGGYATPPSNYSSAYPGNGGGGGGAGAGGGLSNSDHNPYRTATPNRRGQYSDAVMEELESQNDREVEGMSAKVRMLRDLTSAIGDEIRDSSALADKMNDQFENARVRLRGTMNRMLAMARRTGIGWRVWLAFFAAITVLFWYVWLF